MDLLHPVVSSLTPDGEGVRDGSTELPTLGYTNPDVSEFLACYRFSALWVLRLSRGAEISSWGRLEMRPAPLATLSLGFPGAPSTSTTSQLLSILVPNPSNPSIA